MSDTSDTEPELIIPDILKDDSEADDLQSDKADETHPDIKQRCAIEFCVKLHKSATETLDMIRQAYGDDALSKTTVFRWHHRFSSGRESIQDNPRAGCPSTAVTKANIAFAKAILQEDRRTSLRTMSNILRISTGSTHRIVTSEIGMRWRDDRWIPPDLSPEVCKRRVKHSKDFLARVEKDKNFLKRIIVCGEVCEWKLPDTPASKRLCTAASLRKTRLIIFFDVNGVILHHWLGKTSSVTGGSYSTLFRKHLLTSIQQERSELSSGQWYLHMDNPDPRIISGCQKAIAEIGATLLDLPPESADLAPCKFWLIPELTNALESFRIRGKGNLEKFTSIALHTLSRNGLQMTFDTWVDRHRKCVASKGNYFEDDDM